MLYVAVVSGKGLDSGHWFCRRWAWGGTTRAVRPFPLPFREAKNVTDSSEEPAMEQPRYEAVPWLAPRMKIEERL